MLIFFSVIETILFCSWNSSLWTIENLQLFSYLINCLFLCFFTQNKSSSSSNHNSSWSNEDPLEGANHSQWWYHSQSKYYHLRNAPRSSRTGTEGLYEVFIGTITRVHLAHSVRWIISSVYVSQYKHQCMACVQYSTN